MHISEAELTVRTEARKVETIRVGLTVDRNEVGANATVAVILLLTG